MLLSLICLTLNHLHYLTPVHQYGPNTSSELFKIFFVCLFYMNFHFFNKVYLLINMPLRKQKQIFLVQFSLCGYRVLFQEKNWIISVKAVNVLCILITNKNNKLQKIFHLKIHIVTHIHIYILKPICFASMTYDWSCYICITVVPH